MIKLKLFHILLVIYSMDFWIQASVTTFSKESFNIKEAVNAALKEVAKLQQLEEKLEKNGLVKHPNTLRNYHGHQFHVDQEMLHNAQFRGRVAVEMAKYLKNNSDIPLEVLSQEITDEMLQDASDKIACDKEPQCKPSKYRTADGSCNNLKYPLRGRAFTPFVRWVPPQYDDYVSSPRTKGVDGEALPNARIISTTLSPDVNDPYPQYSMMLIMFAQFVVHDTNFAFTSLNLNCCDPKIKEDPSLRHPDCFEISIPKDDYFFAQYNQTCNHFFRSYPTSKYGCRPGVREQINFVTHFIDASHLYGNSESETKPLRSMQGGKLKPSTQGNILPPDDGAGENAVPCNRRDNEPQCFKSGDFRVNQNLMANALHQIFFREHNRIAGVLSRLNNQWNDETLFQESRKIIGAMLQHIFFKEILPNFLGDRKMREYGLKLQDRGFYTGYDENEDPTLANGFVAGTFRFGHTFVQGNLSSVTEERRIVDHYRLGFWFFRPFPMYSDEKLDQLLRGATSDRAQKFDTFFTEEMTNRMFQTFFQQYGEDLLAINIHRGRDHGLAGYPTWRKFCNLSEISSFDDLRPIMTQRSVDVFRRLYSNVRDIDLYVGMLAEIPESGQIVGPLISCMLGKSMGKLKRGDRFWYENGNMESSFTANQLQEIRKASFSRVLCDNTNIMNIQMNSMHVPSLFNPLYPCIGGFIPRVNLEAWKVNTGILSL